MQLISVVAVAVFAQEIVDKAGVDAETKALIRRVVQANVKAHRGPGYLTRLTSG